MEQNGTTGAFLIGYEPIAIPWACAGFIVSFLLKIYLKDWLKSRLRRKRNK